MKKLIDSNKGIRLIQAFGGVGTQAMALSRMNVPYEDYKMIEFDKYCIKSYNAIHGTNYETQDICDIHIDDLGIIDKTHYQYIMTYSFPCFIGATMVNTVNGNKPIKDIKVGEEVLTHDGTYQKVIASQCVGKKHIWGICPNDYDLPDDYYSNFTWCTPNHRFYVRNKITDEIEYRSIENIFEEGYEKYDFARLINSTKIKWEPIKNIIVSYPKDELVYDITVEKNHSFVANGFVVHNCQDLSLAGKQAGMDEGSGTRSSLLWQVGRILQESVDKATVEGINKTAYLPDILTLENVPQVHSKKNIDNFNKWLRQLEDFGYISKWADLNAKDYGIPQNRNRTFCVSWLDHDADFEFPKPIELKYSMEDCLQPESEVPEKQYIQWERARKLIDQMIDKYGDELEELV